MNKLLMIFLVILNILLINCAVSKENSLLVMSFNIRYDSPNDGINQWKNRKDKVVNVLLNERIDICGMQEVLKHQLDYIMENLPGYDYFGVGRDDGLEKGEYGPVIYKKDKLELLDSGTFWLSDTPEKPGNLCWNTVCNRICTWGKFKRKDNNSIIYFFNTHFSHVSDEARRKSAKFILTKINEIAESNAVILTGDFNCIEKSDAYNTLVSGLPELYNTRYISKNDHTGRNQTYNGFGSRKDDFVIDYIFVDRNLAVMNHKYLPENDGELYISDHYPVIIELH